MRSAAAKMPSFPAHITTAIAAQSLAAQALAATAAVAEAGGGWHLGRSSASRLGSGCAGPERWGHSQDSANEPGSQSPKFHGLAGLPRVTTEGEVVSRTHAQQVRKTEVR